MNEQEDFDKDRALSEAQLIVTGEEDRLISVSFPGSAANDLVWHLHRGELGNSSHNQNIPLAERTGMIFWRLNFALPLLKSQETVTIDISAREINQIGKDLDDWKRDDARFRAARDAFIILKSAFEERKGQK